MSNSIRKWIAKALTWLAIALLVIGAILIIVGGATPLSFMGMQLSATSWGWIAVGGAVLAFVVGYAVSSDGAKEVLSVVSGAAKSVIDTAEDVLFSSTTLWIALAVLVFIAVKD